MGYQNLQRASHPRLWELAEAQHGVVARRQLLQLGFSSQSIKHRIGIGRLHVVGRGVYAVGRPHLTMHGRWMAAVLACGAEAVISHESAAALWKIRPPKSNEIEVSVPSSVARARPGVLVHRRSTLVERDVKRRYAIPVTSPVCTLIDIATCLEERQIEAAINEADKLYLTDPDELRSALDKIVPRPGVGVLREILDRPTFRLTDSELERRFLRIVRGADLPLPQTGRRLNGFKVDFYWPGLGLVVETDGLRYHRTSAQQERDRIRDHAHAAAGLTPLRFTWAQVRFEPGHVQATLTAVAHRLGAAQSPHDVPQRRPT